jgi:nucleotide-binding universal stress UspA family protein
MEKRILLVVTPEASADRLSAVRDAAERARASGGMLRMMFASPIPRERLDGHDRVVADVDREMARIAGDADEVLRRLAAEVDDVPVERVVRFGRLADEVGTEAEVFAADLVAVAAPAPPGLRHEILAWYLEWMALGSKTPVILLPDTAEGGDDRMREALAMTALRQI